MELWCCCFAQQLALYLSINHVDMFLCFILMRFQDSVRPTYMKLNVSEEEDPIWYTVRASRSLRYANSTNATTNSTNTSSAAFQTHAKPVRAQTQPKYEYNNELLTLAIDLGERLLPAFNTKTGIPYGTVNLMYGVPSGNCAADDVDYYCALGGGISYVSLMMGYPSTDRRDVIAVCINVVILDVMCRYQILCSHSYIYFLFV
jgi:hypothetical protein